MKKWNKTGIALCLCMVTALTGCAGKEKKSSEDSKEAKKTKTEIQVFIAASMNTAMEEAAEEYAKIEPDVKITYHADSSGTLLTQIQEGYACDIFFSAAQKQMDVLEENGLIVKGSREDVLNNQVAIITYKGSGTKVTDFKSIAKASSIALADGSVPVGKYTRQAMVNLKLVPAADDVSAITTQQVSDALGGVKISEEGNVSKVFTAVSEQSSEVGFVYMSDIYSNAQDKNVEVIQKVSNDLTGSIVYPVCQVVNKEADDAETKAAAKFRDFIMSDTAKKIFDKYKFDTNLK